MRTIFSLPWQRVCSSAHISLAAPTTYFVSADQAILYRSAGLDVVWPRMLAILIIGSLLFALSLARIRKTISRRG